MYIRIRAKIHNGYSYKEILSLWQLLEKHTVKYIMVDGFATNLHGFTRTTADMNLWIKDSVENRVNLRSALKEIEIGDSEYIETMDFIPGWTSVFLGSGFELDIMTYLKGFEQIRFDECYSVAPIAYIFEFSTPQSFN